MEDLTRLTDGQVSWELPLTIEYLFLFPNSNAFIEDFNLIHSKLLVFNNLQKSSKVLRMRMFFAKA